MIPISPIVCPTDTRRLYRLALASGQEQGQITYPGEGKESHVSYGRGLMLEFILLFWIF